MTDQEKAKLFTQSWVAVQPSMVEGWGITNIEANVCGTPVVASNVDGLKDSVINGETGYLVKPESPEALEEAIIKIISSSKIREQMSKKAETWGNKFDWVKSSKVFINLILDAANTESKFSSLNKSISIVSN